MGDLAEDGVPQEPAAEALGELEEASSPNAHAAPAHGSPIQPLLGSHASSAQGAGHLSWEPHFLIPRRLPLFAAGERDELEEEASSSPPHPQAPIRSGQRDQRGRGQRDQRGRGQRDQRG